MGRLVRVDTEIVRRSLARSRTIAAELIQSGRVYVDGQQVAKPSRQIDTSQALLVKEGSQVDYVSRGGHKLAGALTELEKREFYTPISIADKYVLDAGASTGGFTDVLIKRGAKHVYAVDVGYGQISWALRTDSRVSCIERTNIRYLNPEQLSPTPQIAVGDLSFISIKLIIPALARSCALDADFFIMIKPQFEVGREKLSEGGVVRNDKDKIECIVDICHFAITEQNLNVAAIIPSPLPGPSGNVEYFIWLRRLQEQSIKPSELLQQAQIAVESGPHT